MSDITASTLYKFLYDPQTQEYKGITRAKPFPNNSTHVIPHFMYGFKTIFNITENRWELQSREIFFDHVKWLDQEQGFLNDHHDEVIQQLILLSKKMDSHFVHYSQDYSKVLARCLAIENSLVKLDTAIYNSSVHLKSVMNTLGSIRNDIHDGFFRNDIHNEGNVDRYITLIEHVDNNTVIGLFKKLLRKLKIKCGLR